MAGESYQSTKPGDSKFKPSMVNGGKDKTVGVMNGGKGSKGVTNDALKSMGRNLARVANQKRG